MTGDRSRASTGPRSLTPMVTKTRLASCERTVDHDVMRAKAGQLARSPAIAAHQWSKSGTR